MTETTTQVNGSAYEDTHRRQRYARRIANVLRYMEQHLDEDLSVPTLAAIAHFSPFHFHRQFTAYSGMTLGKLVRLLRLRRASLRLAFVPDMSVTEIGLEAGYQNAESFSRAFKNLQGQSPAQFRRDPVWQSWQRQYPIQQTDNAMHSEVEIVHFPTTRVAAVEYTGPERQSFAATRQLIEWRRANQVPPEQGATYGIHYSDPATTEEDKYRLDLCVSYDGDIQTNPQGVIAKSIPGGRCARVRHLGSRDYMPEADYLYREWLPASGEALRDFPIFFHYVNIGPGVTDAEMMTDLYLPLR